MKHLARRALPTAEPSRPYTYWWHGNRLDQGDTGTCVGHGCVHLVENSPILPAGTLNPFDLYREIVLLDEWPENDSEATAPIDDLQSGTSVRAGMKALQARGLISQYLWAWDAETAARWVWTRGPIVIGINWYSGFDRPDSSYLVEATGSVRGGHCVVMDGVNMQTRTLRFLNSWGPQFGNKGVARMSFDTFQRVLDEDGECAMAVETA